MKNYSLRHDVMRLRVFSLFFIAYFISKVTGDLNYTDVLPRTNPMSTSAEADEESPNIIIILTDEHNIRTLSCYREYFENQGHNQEFWGEGNVVDTPNIDKIASAGAMFTNYYTVYPICTPSRASFFTGLYPTEKTGAYKNHKKLIFTMSTFANDLKKEKGYSTAYLGKWHLDGGKKPGVLSGNSENTKRKFGFGSNKYRYNRGHWKFMDMKEQKVKVFEFEEGQKNCDCKGGDEKHYTTDFLFDKSIQYMKNKKDSGNPFAVVLSIPDPHGPNIVRKPYNDMYRSMHFSLPYSMRRMAKRKPAGPTWAEDMWSIIVDVSMKQSKKDLDAIEHSELYQSDMNQYYGMVKCIDDNVGKMRRFLKKNNIYDNTIIVFTSDHGDLLGEHGRKNKGLAYRTSAGIPFLMSYPNKIRKGKIITTPYTTVDFAPSILNMVGITTDETKFDGIDFTEELLNNNLVTKNEDQIRFIRGKNWIGAITQRFKLVISSTDVPWMFDMQNDHVELMNNFETEEFADVRERLLDALYKEIIEDDFKFNEMNRFFIYWSMPKCLDSRNAIPGNEEYLCTDIGTGTELGGLPDEICVNGAIKKHCSVSCENCCEDSEGKMLHRRELLGCSELKDYCDEYRVPEFCPVTCGLC